MSVLSAEIGAVSSTMSEQAQPNQSDTTCSEKYWAERVRRYKEVFKINTTLGKKRGKKRKNISAQGNYQCDICEINIDLFAKDLQPSSSLIATARGKRQAAKVRKIAQVKKSFSCEVCSISFLNQSSLGAHLTGKKQSAKVREIAGVKKSFSCEVCSIPYFNLQSSLDSHLIGKKHLKMVAYAGKSFKCDVCYISTSCHKKLDKHLKGIFHQKMVNSGVVSPSDPFYCEVCSRSAFSQSSFDAHLIGKKHFGRKRQKMASALKKQNASALATSVFAQPQELTRPILL